MSEPLDLDKIMAEHADHGEGVWCGATPSVVDEEDPEPDNCLPYRLAAEVARQAEQIAAVRALHPRMYLEDYPDNPSTCHECQQYWPCSTVRALDGGAS